MLSSRLFRLAGLAIASIAVASCSSTGTALEVGMTQEQAIHAMGQPDLKDTVTDPRTGASELRYAWVARAKVATFATDDRIAEVRPLDTGTRVPAQPSSSEARVQTPFDPVETPLNYVFYPVKFALVWIGAGLNCVAEGECRQPQVKPPYAG